MPGLARYMMLQIGYSSAVNSVQHLKSPHLTNVHADAAPLSNILSVAKAYSAWDTFDYGTALRKFKDMDWKTSGIATLQPSRHALDLLSTLDSAPDSKAEPAFLIDMVNNAVRRGGEKRFDDAVLRLYRSSELLAQLVLWNDFSIDTGDVDVSRCPGAIGSVLDQRRSEFDGRIRIGLEMSYRVLEAFGHPAGAHYAGDPELRSYLGQRNCSILAHGFQLATENFYKELKWRVFRLMKKTVDNFEYRVAKSQFPWLINSFARYLS